jgi:hypothetical protein
MQEIYGTPASGGGNTHLPSARRPVAATDAASGRVPLAAVF